MSTGTVALVLQRKDASPVLVDTLSDNQEIEFLETALGRGENNALNQVYDRRAQQAEEEEIFSDYVESLISKPFVRTEIRDHGIQWFRSKIRIERYQRNELEAMKVIANFALQVYQDDPSRTEFTLAGPTSQVKIKIVVLPTTPQN